MKPAGCRRKGSAGELEIVALLKAAGLEARRVPLSGAMASTGFGGDVLVKDGNGEERWEVKRRGQGFARLERWLQDANVVAFRCDRGEWMVCLRLGAYLQGRGGAHAPVALTRAYVASEAAGVLAELSRCSADWILESREHLEHAAAVGLAHARVGVRARIQAARELVLAARGWDVEPQP